MFRLYCHSQFYSRFLSETCPAAHGDSVSHGLEDLADLVLDMATVIVERSGVLPAILPQVSSQVSFDSNSAPH